MIKSLGTLSSSLIIGALINVCALPYLARIYGPADFALYGVVVAVVSVLSVISNGRLDQAVLVSVSDERDSVFGCGLSVAAVFAALVFALGFFENQTHYLWYVAAAILSNSFFQLVYSHSLAKDEIFRCAFMNVLRVLFLVGSQIILSFLLPSASLLDGLLLQNIIIITVTIIIFGSYVSKFNLETLRKYSDFFKENAPHALFNSLSHNSPYFMISHFLGAEVTGFYTLVDRLMKMPIQFFSGVVRQLFIKSIRKEDNKVKAAKECSDAALKMVIVAFLFYLSAFFLPDRFIESTIGAQWVGAKWMLLYVGLGYVFVFANPPASAYIVANRQVKFMLHMQVYEFLLKIAAFIALYVWLKDMKAVVAISASLALYNIILFVYVRNKGRSIGVINGR